MDMPGFKGDIDSKLLYLSVGRGCKQYCNVRAGGEAKSDGTGFGPTYARGNNDRTTVRH